MEISVIGLNHHSAPLHVREQYALPPELAVKLLRAIHEEALCGEALVLDTCNRTELYAVADAPLSVAHLLRHIAHLKNLKSMPPAGKPAAEPPPFYHYHGLAAVEHLFRVAASLDSQVVGEHEILGQLKTAYRRAVEAHTTRFIMNRLMHRAFHVGKRVQTETRLGHGATNLSESAVALSRRILGDLDGKTIVLIGAGQTAELAAEALIRSGATGLIVANRSLGRARDLAEKFSDDPQKLARGEDSCPALRRNAARCSLGQMRTDAGRSRRNSVRAIPLSKIASVLPRADLLISSTASPDCVLTREKFTALRRRGGRPLVIMDLAVPRDVDPRVAELPNVSLFNLGDLDRIVAENLRHRAKEIPRAEKIVGEEVLRLGEWIESLDAVRVIKLLRARAAELQEAEVRRYRNKFLPADRERLELFARGLCNKMLSDPIAFLRGRTAAGDPTDRAQGRAERSRMDGATPADVDLARRIFRLDSEEADR